MAETGASAAEPLPAACRPSYLTDALRRCGALGDGARVGEVAIERSWPTVLSRLIRLRLSYEGAAAGAPQSLIFKTALPERAGPAWGGGRHEARFYKQVAAAMRAPLVPRCFDAHWADDTKEWHLLLEDLTDTHLIATAWPLPPSFAQMQRIIAGSARFHAAWWDDPRLGNRVGTWPNPDEGLGHFAETIARFADAAGDLLSAERRLLYQRLIEDGHRLNARYRMRHNMTIVQGDAHVWNIFLPRAEDSDDTRLFDWDCWRIDAATDDLAYMMALHWYPERRRQYEKRLLDHYHAVLMQEGVTAYDRHALDDDYRLSALWHIATPVWQWNNRIPPVIWWNNLERIFLAVDDLGGRELLAG